MWKRLNSKQMYEQFSYREVFLIKRFLIERFYCIYNYIYTVKPLYRKLFFYSTFFLIERFSYKEVFTFPMILRIHLGPIIENALYIVHRVIHNLYVIYIVYLFILFI